MTSDYLRHEAERRAQQVRVDRVIFLIGVLCLVLLAAMPGLEGLG